MKGVRLIIALLLTPICGYLAVPFLTYGVLGVYAAFKEHEAWSLEWCLAAMVYWTLLLIGIYYVAVVVAAWVWVFARRNSRGVNSQSTN